MILKEADDHLEDIGELERLRDVAPASFHSAISKQIANIRAGHAGERSAAHFISREFRQSDRVLVVHDLRFGTDGDFAQIDHLLIHRVQAAAWVLETKNYSGRLSCDEHGDWNVWRNGKPQAIPSPTSQVRRQCRALRIWLDTNKINSIRQIHPVVLISPTSSIDRRKLPPDTHVVKSDNFTEWWNNQADAIGFGTALEMLGRHVLRGMSQHDFESLGRHLISAHVPAKHDWQAKLGIPCTTKLTKAAGAKQSLVQALQDNVAIVSSEGDAHIIITPHGEIKVARIPDGRFTVRNDKSEPLIEIVKNACKGRGRWNPRFRNWLISEENLPEILAILDRHVRRLGSR